MVHCQIWNTLSHNHHVNMNDKRTLYVRQKKRTETYIITKKLN